MSIDLVLVLLARQMETICWHEKSRRSVHAMQHDAGGGQPATVHSMSDMRCTTGKRSRTLTLADALTACSVCDWGAQPWHASK
jgi:hypothetical protein